MSHCFLLVKVFVKFYCDVWCVQLILYVVILWVSFFYVFSNFESLVSWKLYILASLLKISCVYQENKTILSGSFSYWSHGNDTVDFLAKSATKSDKKVMHLDQDRKRFSLSTSAIWNEIKSSASLLLPKNYLLLRRVFSFYHCVLSIFHISCRFHNQNIRIFIPS